MPMVNLSDAAHRTAKARAALAGTTLTHYISAAVLAYTGTPAPAAAPIDRRAKSWTAQARIWDRSRGAFEAETDPFPLASTGALPAIAAQLLQQAHGTDASIADRARADLPRFRQVLARGDSAAMRLDYTVEELPFTLVLDVWRGASAPAEPNAPGREPAAEPAPLRHSAELAPAVPGAPGADPIT